MRTRGLSGAKRGSPRIAVHTLGHAKSETANGPDGVMHAVHVPTATTSILLNNYPNPWSRPDAGTVDE
jgi:hypothetical protein